MRTYNLVRNYDKAMEQYKNYIQNNPKEQLARFYSVKKDNKNAKKYYKLAHEENPSDIIYFYQVCFEADQFYKDPWVKLNYYEQLLEKYSGQSGYLIEFSQRQIS